MYNVGDVFHDGRNWRMVDEIVPLGYNTHIVDEPKPDKPKPVQQTEVKPAGKKKK